MTSIRARQRKGHIMSRDENGKTGRGIKAAWRWLLLAAVVLLLAGAVYPVHAQQFNSDNWWVLPHGVGMGIATMPVKG